AAVVGDGGKPGLPGEVFCLGPRVRGERVAQLEAVLFRARRDAGVVGEEELEPGTVEQPAHLALLPRAPGRDQQLHQPSAWRWRSKRLAIARWPTSTSRSSSARLKVPCSPVPCTSTNRSGARMTRLASTPASLSSV